ncbi:hypothetical protein BCE_2467 [Bacillus cereus ATCC 10987]|uniref:Uncharacterized protein n=1 Tax=Bacillus cereus (strain ATCC 10987 / NRS 248) TaxID=222523 RepID=Q738C8_BACC1|nr:hypothetical protein BCE_2467 [Bacillus cereus ATCC 10987]
MYIQEEVLLLKVVLPIVLILFVFVSMYMTYEKRKKQR